MTKTSKTMGVQQILLSPDPETRALLEYLCQQSGKLYNTGIYFARQTLFKTGKLLTGKFDLAFKPSVSKSLLARSMPSTPMQQTLMSVTEAFKSFKNLRDLHEKGQLHFRPKPPSYLLDINQALSIDLGTADNLAACVDTLGNSFLIDARDLKAKNQLWNKKVSTRKEGKSQDYWDNWLDCVTRKRNHQMRDGINKAAKLIINHCLKYGIGTLVIGWNEGFKTNANLGNLNNQKFVQMPLGKLKSRVKQLCDLHGIRFIETEEAYTSKASFLDGDSLPKYGEKPMGWKASGSRIKRGLYRTSDGFVVNADLNGAANILRKVSGRLGIMLNQLSRRYAAIVARIRLN
ncbi:MULTISPECIES: RNA-guided endonuclease InsQ/TnpB family protein [Planktothrix]|jgi:IS605 OrfB family transposase|uniref:Transposase, IS605 OrfB n=2 Tax=Planktothrix TaxID=54304 RepID=A0A4P5ZLW7_PLAAG|nr:MULTISPECIES: transposase [Planktothrix]CAD5967105.1 hypothetical protein NO108_03910 [Planktothrix rubescens]CAC5343157.1 hypothetical protein PLAN_30391 [Planktothrix rubescens NIVA-CYA 18]CAD5977211.1 hypothetical protein PCC7821_04235 [Planktothrix rubescens NIVA-CYA 18]CAH2574782.1 hypothetical protein PRNO82_04146 [Planktothrix rubescens]GDZ96164.1 transposase, IS605 OrfB [Planktothrix agardhii CCAP 1459/11A]